MQDTIPVSGYPPSPDSLAGVDTLAGTVGRFHLSGANTLQTAPSGIWDAIAVYGPDSSPVAGNVAAEATAAMGVMTGNHLFQLLSLAVLVVYCWMIYAFREQTKLCLKGLVDFKIESRLSTEHGRLYDRFLNYAVGMSVAGIGIFVTKLISGNADIEGSVPRWMLQPAAFLILAVLAAILAFQFVVLKAAGKLTFSEDMTGSVIQVKKQYLAAASLFITPAALLYTGVNSAWDSIVLYIAVFVVVVASATFAVKTFILFIRQKVSLLVWILYLCAVEILPLSLAVLLVTKNV